MSLTETFYYPKQRLSYSKKVEDDYQWCKDVMDTLILNFASDWTDDSMASEYQRKLANYQLYNNILNQKDFEKECNPLGIEVGQFKDTIQPYNKTYNKIQVLLGEELKRPLNFRTILVNSDGIRSKLLERDEALRSLLLQHISQFVERLMSLRISPNMSAQERQRAQAEVQQAIEASIPQSKLQELQSHTFLSAKEHLANQILNYLILQESVKEKMNDAFKHALISGEEFIWVGMNNNQPTIEILNPLGVFYHKSPEVKYVQDGLYAGYRTMMSAGDVIDRFGDYMKDEDIERLQTHPSGIHGIRNDIVGKNMQYFHDDVYHIYQSRLMKNYDSEGSYGDTDQGTDWLVTHVEWRSEKKVYFIEFTNEYGDIQKEIADENFKIPVYATKRTTTGMYGKKRTQYLFDGFTVEEGWIPEVWEGVKIGSDIYCCMGPKPHQHRSIDNPNDVKLGYHGVIYNNMNARSVSLMDRMKPFQYLYFIIVHKLKKLIARDRGKVFHYDMSMIPEELGLEKTIYYLEEMDIDFFNPLMNAESPGAFQRGKISGSTDRSNMQHIMNYINLMAAIDDQISDVAGITRQREGQVNPNEAVTNAQQNIIQSSTITEAAYFQPHFKLWESVLTSAIQLTQSAWKGQSIIKQYVLDDLSLQTLNINEDDLHNADFGVFLSNSMKEADVFQTLKSLAQPLVQNDKAKMSDIISIYKATSSNEIEKKIKQSEKIAQQEQERQLQQQQQMQQQMLEAQAQEREDKQLHEKEIELLKGEIQVRLKEMELSSQEPSNKDSELDYLKALADIEAKKEKLEIDRDKLELEKKKLKQQKELEQKKINMQKSKSASSGK